MVGRCGKNIPERIMVGFLGKIFGDPNEKEIKRLQPKIDEINKLEERVEKLNDEDLANKTQDLKKRLKDKLANDERLIDINTLEDEERKRRFREAVTEALEEILPEAFALVREAVKRTIGQRHYDVQLIGGIILHEGKIAEMKTGEGKHWSRLWHCI